MWGQHLKKKGRWWHYYRAVPREFSDHETKSLISFSLKTSDLKEARRMAANISFELDQKWREAAERNLSLKADHKLERYQAANSVQILHGLQPKVATELSDQDLLERLRLLLRQPLQTSEQKAVLGLVEKPQMSLNDAFDRFWDYIKDEWSLLSHDQCRVKRNIYLKAIRNFQSVFGPIAFQDVERHHAIKFRGWWVERLQERKLKPYTGNREINSLRRMFTVNLDIEGSSKTNPFSGVRLKEQNEVSRIPFSTEQIVELLKPGSLGTLHSDFILLFHLLVNTGMRPVEAIGLELSDINLAGDVPHVHIRKNRTRGLKTSHSERQIPLVGVSLVAAQELVSQGGWGKRLGKNMYATSIINQHLRSNKIKISKQQSLYSLRHWFQDQLTKRDIVDRAQAQLMGHKFRRPKYGYGKDLIELKKILVEFAIE